MLLIIFPKLYQNLSQFVVIFYSSFMVFQNYLHHHSYVSLADVTEPNFLPLKIYRYSLATTTPHDVGLKEKEKGGKDYG